jgi:hypothetical protein
MNKATQLSREMEKVNVNIQCGPSLPQIVESEVSALFKTLD